MSECAQVTLVTIKTVVPGGLTVEKFYKNILAIGDLIHMAETNLPDNQ